MRVKIQILFTCILVFFVPFTTRAFDLASKPDSTEVDTAYFRVFNESQVLDDSVNESHFIPFRNVQRYSLNDRNFPYILAGNPGHAIYSPLVQSSVPHDQGMGAYSSFYPYIFRRENIDYYWNKPPYTSIFYMSGAKKEEQLDLLHARNFGENLNMSIRLNKKGSEGFYNHLKTRGSHFNVAFNYRTANHRYALLGNYYFNKNEIQENGGYDDFEQIENPETVGSSRLSNASNEIREEGILVSQSIGIGNLAGEDEPFVLPLFRIGHDFHYFGGYRYYMDNGDVDLFQRIPSLNTDFYENIYFDSSKTSDSIVHASLSNQVNFTIYPGRKPLTVYARHELTGYDQKQQVDTLYENLFTGARFDLGLNDYRLTMSAELGISGFREGDVESDLVLTNSISDSSDTWMFAGHLGYRLTQPLFNQLRYISNNFIWNNHFNKEKRLFAQGSVSKKGYVLSGEFGTIGDLIYYNLHAKPEQSATGVSYFTANLSKLLSWNHFHLDNNISYQSISNREIMPLPQLLIRECVYFQSSVFKKVLKYQIGVDIFYYSTHYGYAYMPALNLYHVQNETQTGSYPYIDLFLNLQLKRAFFFLKMEHFNKGMSGTNYYQVPGYPYPPRSFKFGIRWALFD